MSKMVGLGWEDVNLNNNGADIQVPVINNMTLMDITVDVAFMPTISPNKAGWAEVLCQGYILPSLMAIPAKGPAYVAAQASSDFGPPVIDNPNSSIVASSGFTDGALFSIILKCWVGTTPDAATTSRNVTQSLSLFVPAGSVIALHMDHMGVPGDAEMQVVLSYF